MRFHTTHKLVSYLLAATAVGTLISSGTVPLSAIGLLVAMGGFSWFTEPSTKLGALLDRAGLIFNVGALGFFAISLYQVIRSFPEPDLSPVLNLVLFLLAYKLFYRRTNRDYLQLYILSFLLVLAAAWLAQSVWFVLGFAAYVVLATWTLILFHLRHEIEDNYLVKHLPEAASEKVTAARVLNSRRVVGRPFFLATGAMALCVLAGAGLVFAAVPRIGLGFLSGAVRRRMNIVGFSDEVRLGQHGVLSRDNDTVVLRAEVERIAAMNDEKRDQEIVQLYWRGTVYDQYENGQWMRSKNAASATPLHRQPWDDGGEVVFVGTKRASLAGTDYQHIEAVGLSFPVAFALDQPVAYRWLPPRAGSFTTTNVEPRWAGEVALRTARVLPGGTLRPLGDFHGGRYGAYSRPARPHIGAGVPLAELAPGSFDNYLRTPGTLSPRVTELARTIARGQVTPAAKMQAVVSWLRRTHQYTTNLKRDPTIPDPLEDFLFNQTAGHCEYFASSAAILLRLTGVPTRYVNGFLGGEWNALGKHITVRDNRAHSWVEAYLGTFGWVRVEPTPVGNASTRMSRLRQLVDSVELFWSRWVIDYDASRQVDLAKRLGKGLGFQRHGARARMSWPKPGRNVAIIVAVAVAAGLGGWYLRRRVRGPVAGSTVLNRRNGPPIFRLYQKALDRLGARGFTRDPAETPGEFVVRLERAQTSDAAAMARITRLYVAARYGGHHVSGEKLAALAADVEAMGRTTASERSAV